MRYRYYLANVYMYSFVLFSVLAMPNMNQRMFLYSVALRRVDSSGANMLLYSVTLHSHILRHLAGRTGL